MDDSHIPLSILWEYSQNPNPSELRTGPYWEHLSDCEDCVSVLWLCKTSISVEGVKAKLKRLRHGRFRLKCAAGIFVEAATAVASLDR
jgi:hypothetical protein